MDSPLPSLNTVTETDLLRLVNETKPPESRSLEYKTTVDFKDAEKQRKFLKTVAALANGRGGDLIYGIAAVDGIPLKLEPLQNFNADATELQVTALIRAHLQPRLFGVQFHCVEIAGGGHVFIVRVPKTWTGPHMLMQGENRFYIRDGNGNRPMDFTDVSLAFADATDSTQKLNALRFERCAYILNGDTPVPLSTGVRFVLHLIPLESLSRRPRFDVSMLYRKIEALWPIEGDGLDREINMEGAYTKTSDGAGGFSNYSMCFRSGVIEAVSVNLSHEDRDQVKWVHVPKAEARLIRAVATYLEFLRDLEVQAPVVACVSLLDVQGHRPNRPPGPGDFYHWMETTKVIQRPHLHLQPVLLESFEVDITKALYPAFNSVWHECSRLRSPNYDDKGNWKTQ